MKQRRLENKLGKQSFQCDIKEPLTKTLNKLSEKILEKSKATTAVIRKVVEDFPGTLMFQLTYKTIPVICCKISKMERKKIKIEPNVMKIVDKNTDFKSKSQFMLRPDPRCKVVRNQGHQFITIKKNPVEMEGVKILF